MLLEEDGEDTICTAIFIDGSTHKSLYRFRPSSEEVVPYSCSLVFLPFTRKITIEFNLQPSFVLPAYIECARRDVITGW